MSMAKGNMFLMSDFNPHEVTAEDVQVGGSKRAIRLTLWRGATEGRQPVDARPILCDVRLGLDGDGSSSQRTSRCYRQPHLEYSYLALRSLTPPSTLPSRVIPPLARTLPLVVTHMGGTSRLKCPRRWTKTKTICRLWSSCSGKQRSMYVSPP